MDNLDEVNQVNLVGEEDDEERQQSNEATEILTIHLPRAHVESPDPAINKYEPNYIDVEQHKYVHFIRPVMITEQEQLELQQHINSKNFVAASTGSSPDYTEIVMNRENFMKNKNDQNNELYKKYAKHLVRHDENSDTPQSFSNTVHLESIMRNNESRESNQLYQFPATDEAARIQNISQINTTRDLKSPTRIKKGTN